MMRADALVTSWRENMSGRIIIQMSGFTSDRGVARVVLFDPSLGRHTKTLEIEGGRAEVTFEDMPHGQYAFSAYHDEDEDGALTTDAQGKITEAVSSLEQSQFELEGDEILVEIEL